MRPTPLSQLLERIALPSTSQCVICSAAIDSRLVTPGSLFFALSGEKTDGHHHLVEAAAKGAVAACVSKSYRGPSYGLELIAVADVMHALQCLAKNTLAQQKVEVIAISGSLGKTTTKEFAKVLLGSSYSLFATPLSYNSQATLPLTILSARGDEEILLLEMGMSAPGHLRILCDIAPPTLSLITNVTWQHAYAFEEGLEGIAREKSTLFTLPTTQWGLYPAESVHAPLFAATGTCRKKTFSVQGHCADFMAHRNGQILEIIEKEGEAYDIPLVLPMDVYDHNFLAALALARMKHIPWPVLKELVPLLHLPPMRCEKIEKAGIVFINDAFNATVEGMEAVLRNLPAPRGGKRIAVLSEMNGLGAYAEEGHRRVARVALETVDLLLCMGPRARWMGEVWQEARRPYLHFETLEALAAHLSSIMEKGDTILLKGARAFAMDRILTFLFCEAGKDV